MSVLFFEDQLESNLATFAAVSAPPPNHKKSLSHQESLIATNNQLEHWSAVACTQKKRFRR